jgi:ABC-2 type transport system ATP-binding protein
MIPHSPTDLAIDVRGLCKQFGDKTVVNDVSVHMPKGQVWGFLGPNGSGKTTTIRMLCGLLEPTAGDGQCLGFDIRHEAEHIKRATGYMTQKFSFWEDLTIRENLEFVARLYALPDLKQRVDQTLEVLGLQDRQRQVAGMLSGGWKQRLALAAVTMHQPQLLLLDEPTAGVDPQARRDFWDQIHRLSAEGMTVLVSTHYMDEAERCDQIVYLAHGALLAQGRIADITADTGLITYRAQGAGVRGLLDVLRHDPDVAHAAYFGAALHISGQSLEGLQRAMTRCHADDVQWAEVPTSLEDVFIHLMALAGQDERVHT